MLLASLLVYFTPHSALAEEIQFFGDVLLSRGIDQLVAHEGQDGVWRGVPSFFKRDAINIANLEGAVGDKSSCAPSHNPCFAINENNLALLAPFDIVSLANNHSLDLGQTGLKNTIREVRKRGITPLGENEHSSVIRTREGDVGLVVLTDVVNENGDRKQFVLPDSTKTIETISSLKRKTSYVVVYIHWGKELDNLPTERMRNLATQFVKAGADVVVGHHPHVVGTVECIDGRPVVYSLGNFLFDQKYEETKQGAVLRCVIRQGKLSCQLIGTETPMNSFAPKAEKDGIIAKQANEILATCKPAILHVWSDKFTRDLAENSVVWGRTDDKMTTSQIKLYDAAKNKLRFKSLQMPIVSLQPVDVNRDGLQELILIQNIYSTIDEEVAKRIYVYSLDGGMKAIWRGSALSRPLLDAVFISVDAGQSPILIALHSTDSFLLRDKTKPGRIVMSYRWNGFGFTGIKEIKLDTTANYLSYNKGIVKLVGNDGSVVNTLPATDFY
jgi:poly-gamma-glutamate capsule biosynthesis protein CapA/YwtB (metallophosphatase superfamily)